MQSLCHCYADRSLGRKLPAYHWSAVTRLVQKRTHSVSRSQRRFCCPTVCLHTTSAMISVACVLLNYIYIYIIPTPLCTWVRHAIVNLWAVFCGFGEHSFILLWFSFPHACFLAAWHVQLFNSSPAYHLPSLLHDNII